MNESGQTNMPWKSKSMRENQEAFENEMFKKEIEERVMGKAEENLLN